jgi:hypothetical protein
MNPYPGKQIFIGGRLLEGRSLFIKLPTSKLNGVSFISHSNQTRNGVMIPELRTSK